ncbi:DUF6171 family protein [Paenibacillus selenitireducens]|uniref:DUF6171 family protein n=1 Tax=Paenibacillus selenitireducens TaxID=1324314 RepID=UPI00099817D8|nr:DUF6171 family protein [Paenibacillus selenitireducens]
MFRNTVQDVDLPLVTVEEYEIRIEHCRHCEALQYGTTCKYCGCIVEIKSKLQHAKCPYPYAPKW